MCQIVEKGNKMNINGINYSNMNRQQNFQGAKPVVGLASEIEQITKTLRKKGIPVETIPLSKVSKSAEDTVQTVLLTTGAQDTFYAKQLKALIGEVEIEQGDANNLIGETFSIAEPPVPASKILTEMTTPGYNHLTFRTKPQKLNTVV